MAITGTDFDDSNGGFRLDSDQRRDVLGCVRGASASLAVPPDRFGERIEASIDHYRRSEPEGTWRDAYDSVRGIWLLCQADEPSLELIREHLKKLPPLALQHLGERANRVIPELFGEAFESNHFEPPGDMGARFLEWAESVPNAKLLVALSALLSDGGQCVVGRSRSGGKRSASHFEPRIMGLVRGSPERKPKGGRPSEDARLRLVVHLAYDWLWATGQMPERGRSDRTGFGKLVHMVFEWVYLQEGAASQKAVDDAIERATEAATYYLRRYWEEVERGR